MGKHALIFITPALCLNDINQEMSCTDDLLLYVQQSYCQVFFFRTTHFGTEKGR